MMMVNAMNFSKIEQDRILQALLEIAGEKYGAEIKAHLEAKIHEGSDCLRGIATDMHGIPRKGA